MKHLYGTITAFVLLCSCLIPITASAAENTIENYDVITVEYEEYTSNRAYYDSLLYQDYALCVTFGEEYSDSEIEEILNLPETTCDSDSSVQPRGASVPTTTYDVHNSRNYTIEDTIAEKDWVYSNVLFTGCTNYWIKMFNYRYDEDLSVRVFLGGTGNTKDVSAPARSYLYIPVNTTSTDTTFFFGVRPIAHTAGYVTCCLAQ